MVILLIILCIILVCIAFYFYKQTLSVNKYNNDIDIQNTLLDNKNKSLQKDYDTLLVSIKTKEMQLDSVQHKLDKQNEELHTAKIRTEEETKNSKKISSLAFENYFNILEQDYKKKEKEYDELVNTLNNSYAKKQEKLIEELNIVNDELTKIKATRDAAAAAQLKEEEIKNKLSFYCLQLPDTELSDIEKLNALKPTLNFPRVLSMLIWQTYYQKKMTSLCNNILGTETVCGIYKITNQKDNRCYIGQSVDISKRWKDHAKCGLGIDTPAGNKLYSAMQKDGLYSFSWELLEKCPKDQLDEKEKFFINLYNSKNYGYNIVKGNH